jgi:hypothetical protein
VLPGHQQVLQQTAYNDELHGVAYCNGIEFQLLFAAVHVSSIVFLVGLLCCCLILESNSTARHRV